MAKILLSDNLKELDSNILGEYKLYLFSPGVFKLFPRSGDMHKMDVKQMLRFLIMLIYGYRVYVLADMQENILGCVVYASGKNPRYPFAEEKDLICGPYFVRPEHRGKGIAPWMVQYVLEHFELVHGEVYAHVWHKNEASIRCLEKIGFKYVCAMRTTKLLSTCIPDPVGKMLLYKKSLQNQQTICCHPKQGEVKMPQ